MWQKGFTVSEGRPWVKFYCEQARGGCGVISDVMVGNGVAPKIQCCAYTLKVNESFPTDSSWVNHLSAKQLVSEEQEALLRGKEEYFARQRPLGLRVTGARTPRWIDSVSNWISSKVGNLGRLG